MKYYKVKKEYDNLKRRNGKTRKFDGIWVGNELYTEKELEKLANSGVYINLKYFDVVEVSKNKTYWFFGARFAEGLTC